MPYLILFLSFFLAPIFAFAQSDESNEIVEPKPAIAMHGEVKYKPGFQHMDYVNAEAPKKGTLKNFALGTFDSLNPFIVKGSSAAGVSFIGQSLLYDSLMEQSFDEPFSMYGLIAETIEMPENNGWVAFNINKGAKWHDGNPITAEDVVWTFNTVMEKGAPFFKAYYGDVEKVEATSPSRVKFTFKHGDNKELPLILSQLTILPKHYWMREGNDFGETSLTPPLGSGPYKISGVTPGRKIEYTRAGNYWGKDLPINKGKFNFERVTYDYYRDDNVALEAFFSNEYDVRIENTAKLWATSYEGDALKTGRIIKEEIRHNRPQGMQGFFMNLRKDQFQDIAFRKALHYAFDFEWSNKQFAFGSYKRTNSYFENSELAALDGAPQGRVLEILEEFRGQIPEAVFTTRYQPPKTDGSGNARSNLRTAMQTLEKAGYKLGDDGIRVHPETGARLSFEIISSNPLFERWVLPYIANLKRIGVEANFRVLDAAQYQNRINDFDYDMTILSVGQSSSPGNEQHDFWASFKADIPGSRNYMGIQNEAIDALIEMVIQAPNREELVFRTRALDRVLLAGYYAVPHWHTDYWRVAYWKKLGRPETLSDLTPGITYTWFVKE